MNCVYLLVALLVVPYANGLFMPRSMAVSRILGGHRIPSRHAYIPPASATVMMESGVSQQTNTETRVMDLGTEPVFSVAFYPNANCTAWPQNLQVYLTSCQANGASFDHLVYVQNAWVYRFDCDSMCSQCVYNYTIPTDTCLRENSTLSVRVHFGLYSNVTKDVRNANYLSFNERAVDSPGQSCVGVSHTHEVFHRINTCLPDNGFGALWTCNSTAAWGSTCAGADLTETAPIGAGCFSCGSFASTCAPLVSSVFDSSCTGPAALNAVCTITCHPGYAPVGGSTLICGGGGGFLGTADCTPVMCPALTVYDLENVHMEAVGCGSGSLGDTSCALKCGVGYYGSSGFPAPGDSVPAICTGLDVGVSQWVHTAFECLPSSTLVTCGTRLMDRLDIFGDPPSVAGTFVLTCDQSCPIASIYGGGAEFNGSSWYTFDSDFCTAARHHLNVSSGSFDLQVRIDSNYPTDQRIPSYPATLRYGIQSLAYLSTYPVAFSIIKLHTAPIGGPGSLLQSATDNYLVVVTEEGDDSSSSVEDSSPSPSPPAQVEVSAASFSLRARRQPTTTSTTPHHKQHPLSHNRMKLHRKGHNNNNNNMRPL